MKLGAVLAPTKIGLIARFVPRVTLSGIALLCGFRTAFWRFCRALPYQYLDVTRSRDANGNSEELDSPFVASPERAFDSGFEGPAPGGGISRGALGMDTLSGALTMSVNRKIMTDICHGLNEIRHAEMTTNKRATRAIVTKLQEIDHRLNYRVGAKGGKYGADWGEWLYDVTWFKYSDDQYHDHLVDVPLVAECEWSGKFSDVKDDFHKLLLARAGVRLMIYSYYALGGNIHGEEPDRRALREQAARDIAERLAESVRRFRCRQEEDVWLLVGGVWHADDWCRCFTIQNERVVACC